MTRFASRRERADERHNRRIERRQSRIYYARRIAAKVQDARAAARRRAQQRRQRWADWADRRSYKAKGPRRHAVWSAVGDYYGNRAAGVKGTRWTRRIRAKLRADRERRAFRRKWKAYGGFPPGCRCWKYGRPCTC